MTLYLTHRQMFHSEVGGQDRRVTLRPCDTVTHTRAVFSPKRSSERQAPWARRWCRALGLVWTRLLGPAPRASWPRREPACGWRRQNWGCFTFREAISPFSRVALRLSFLAHAVQSKPCSRRPPAGDPAAPWLACPQPPLCNWRVCCALPQTCPGAWPRGSTPRSRPGRSCSRCSSRNATTTAPTAR